MYFSEPRCQIIFYLSLYWTTTEWRHRNTLQAVLYPDPDSMWIRIHGIRIRIQNCRIRIQGFDYQKLKKIKLKSFFGEKFYPKASIKDAQAIGEAFSPQKRASFTYLLTVLYFSGPFLPSWIRIQSGSASDIGSGSTILHLSHAEWKLNIF